MPRWLPLLTLLFAPALIAAPQSKKIRLERPDGAILVATFNTLDDEPRPAVLLLHQAQKSQAEFDFLLGDLHALGFNTLALDLRGHGGSTGPENKDRAFFMKLFTDPDYAPPDIEAALEWLADHPRVDASRIAVMGGSVGANLAYMATGASWGVKTAIVLSGNAENANLLAARVQGFEPGNVLLVAAADDTGRAAHAHAQKMFEQAGEPKKLEILEGSAAHGVSILAESAETRAVALGWLKDQLR